MFAHKELKSYQRENRHAFPESLGLRVHRALSWLKRAENEHQDSDAQFIFLWIAFNAAYASEFNEGHRFSEKRRFLSFLEKLINLDREDLLYKLVWNHYSGAIRVLINNPYVFEPFWAYQNQLLSEQDWLRKLEHSKASAHRALANTDTRKVLAIVFSRLYVLRNQLLHGGATWKSSINRDQIRDGVHILKDIVPTVIHLMMKNPNQLWGEPVYPVVQ